MPRRKDHTRKELTALAIEGGRKIVIEKGPGALTARSVAKEIGYTAGTLYNLFANIDELTAAINIGSMDAFARGLKVAAKIIEDGAIQQIVDDRYGSWDSELGKKIESGSVSFAELESLMLEQGDAKPNTSGRQELLENIVNRYLDNA